MSGPLMIDFRIRDAGNPASRPPREAEGPVDHLRIFELSQLWHALKARYRFVLGMGVLALALVLAVSFVSPMTFRASGRLYLGEIGGKASNAPAQDISLS